MVGERVKHIRGMLGWSQNELARKTGIPQATISRIESGTIESPRLTEIIKIAKAFGTTVDNLLKEH